MPRSARARCERGTALVRADNATGFRGVSWKEQEQPFRGQAEAGEPSPLPHRRRGGAAHARAVAKEPDSAVPKPGPKPGPKPVPAAVAAQRALRAAASEGLTLVCADNATGFLGVARREQEQAVPSFLHAAVNRHLGICNR